MKSNIQRKIWIFIVLFLGVIGITYALGTWSTGFRANDGIETAVDINATDVFDNIIVENDHGEDLFVPTKSFAEIKSMWDNPPVDTCLFTEEEWVGSIALATTAGTFSSHNEATCDTPDGSYGVGNSFVNGTRFQVLKIESPYDMEAFINFRFHYSVNDSEENLKIFVRKDGGAVVPESHFLNLYNDGGSTSTNGPDLDYDNDGNDDLYSIIIDDPWEGEVAVDLSVASEEKIKLYTGTNYIRIEGYDNSGEFSCENGSYTSAANVSFSSDVAGRNIWFSGGRCGDLKLFDQVFNDVTIKPAITGYLVNSESLCDNSDTSQWTRPDPDNENYVHSELMNIIGVYVPKTMTGYLNFRGEYNGISQLEEHFYIFKQKSGGSPVTPDVLHKIYDDGAATGSNAPDYDYDNDSTDDIERFLILDGDNTSSVDTWVDVKSPLMTFFKGMNYMRIQGYNHSCETGSYGTSGESVRFDSPSATPPGEGRVWVTVD